MNLQKYIHEAVSHGRQSTWKTYATIDDITVDSTAKELQDTFYEIPGVDAVYLGEINSWSTAVDLLFEKADSEKLYWCKGSYNGFTNIFVFDIFTDRIYELRYKEHGKKLVKIIRMRGIPSMGSNRDCEVESESVGSRLAVALNDVREIVNKLIKESK